MIDIADKPDWKRAASTLSSGNDPVWTMVAGI
jgi:hypothetical protein